MLTLESFKRLPIFIISMSRWDGDISSASLALAKVFSKHNPVFYIEYPYTIADYVRERKLPSVQPRKNALLFGKNYLLPIPGQAYNLKAATPRLTLPTYSLPEGRINKMFTHYNNQVMAALVKKICKQYQYKDFLFLNSFNPNYLQEIDKYLQPTLSIYHSRDAIEEISIHGLEREIVCVKHYEMSIATSKQLCKNIAERTGELVHYFPNGGDAQLFRSAIENKFEKPKELLDIHTPIIGYTGAICQRFDYELLMKLATQHRDKTIVLVGPRKDKTYSPYNLDEVPNIVFTGPKKIDELPAYLQYFDCAIMPFKYNNLTAGIYPLKINEYLGAGRAVVSTNFSEDIAAFVNEIYLCNTHDEFIASIDKAIVDNSLEKKHVRLEIALSNAWEKRVERFWELAWDTYNQKQ